MSERIYQGVSRPVGTIGKGLLAATLAVSLTGCGGGSQGDKIERVYQSITSGEYEMSGKGVQHALTAQGLGKPPRVYLDNPALSEIAEGTTPVEQAVNYIEEVANEQRSSGIDYRYSLGVDGQQALCLTALMDGMSPDQLSEYRKLIEQANALPGERTDDRRPYTLRGAHAATIAGFCLEVVKGNAENNGFVSVVSLTPETGN
ncbi:hypothetical protein KDA06_05530 [Candidatus Saccharibacteria bacterium]|nr:hypothetical protein [Candidatus Saccharibacteria bacterium]